MSHRVFPIDTFSAEGLRARDDRVAIEEPLEIRARPHGGEETTLAVTMRSPGDDRHLAMGFLLAEGVIANRADIAAIETVRDEAGSALENRLTVRLAPGVTLDVARTSRHVVTSASCGLCGRVTLDALTARISRDPVGVTPLAHEWLTGLGDRLREAQPLFRETGGVHGTALFRAGGDLIAVTEDVGRHNALDKLVGGLVDRDALPADETVVALSGRIGFELVQKALCAGIPTIVAIGAPTSLAIELAARFGMTMIGFLSARRFNVYCGAGRLASA